MKINQLIKLLTILHREFLSTNPVCICVHIYHIVALCYFVHVIMVAAILLWNLWLFFVASTHFPLCKIKSLFRLSPTLFYMYVFANIPFLKLYWSIQLLLLLLNFCEDFTPHEPFCTWYKCMNKNLLIIHIWAWSFLFVKFIFRNSTSWYYYLCELFFLTLCRKGILYSFFLSCQSSFQV